MTGFQYSANAYTNGYAITDIYINQNLTGSNVGLFGDVSAEAQINSIGVTGVVNGLTNVGGLIGQNAGAPVTNTYSIASVTAGNGSSNVGGLIGLNAGAITTSYSAGIVTVGHI